MNGLAGYAGGVVSPVLTAAIESTRQALKQHIPRQWPAAFGGDQVRDIDHADNLRLWQPDVRASVLQFEAMAGMAFETDRKKYAWLVVHRVDARADVSRSVLVTMSRPSTGVLVQQAAVVAEEARNRLMVKSDDVASRDRLSEITSQVVPPFAFWCSVLPLQPERMPRTIDLIELTLALCGLVEQRFKHALAVPRPQYFNPAVVPAILTPGHGSLPSGHATEAFAVSTILHRLIAPRAGEAANGCPELSGMLLALAARIANNRMIAGLHTPIDTSAGRLLGTVLADYLAARCTGSASMSTGEFFGADLKVVNRDLKLQRPDESMDKPIALTASGGELRANQDASCKLEYSKIAVAKSDALEWLWIKAREEWGHAANSKDDTVT
jgi:hypothetical protein